MGQQQIEVPNNLKNILLKWIDKNPYEFLIVNSIGKPITQSKLNEYLNSIFGKKISPSRVQCDKNLVKKVAQFFPRLPKMSPNGRENFVFKMVLFLTK